MRVMHVIKDLGQGGAQVVVRTLVERQMAGGHDVAVVAMPGDVSATVPGRHYDLPPTGSHPRLLVPATVALHRAIRDFRPDVVNAHNPGVMLVTGLATARGRLVPAVATLHGSPRPQYRLNVRTARLAGLPLVACGPSVAALMAEHGRPVDRTIVNGVTLTPPRRSTEEVREELGAKDTFLLLQVGRLTEQKRPLVAVEAFAAAGAPGVLAFAGSGELHGQVLRRAEELGIRDHVRLLGARPDAHDLMRAADAVMLSSSVEGLPLAFLEAMSLGRPVIGSRAPGITELVHDGVDGLLCDPPAEDLARGIRRLADDPGLRDRLGAAAGARKEEFSDTRMAKEYLDEYETLVRPR